MNTSVALERAAPRRSASVWSAIREQATVASGQLVAGVGNLMFALVMARVLSPAAFAELAAFLALYLLIHLPARSLGAATALAPEQVATARRHALRVGLVGSLAVLVAGMGASGLLQLPIGLLAALVTTPTLASLIAVERGRLYGESRHGQVVGTLVAEPIVRLTAGVALALSLGAPGAAAGVVLSDSTALLTARLRLGRSQPSAGGRAQAEEESAHSSRASMAAVFCFLLVALVQSTDVIYGNATLPSGDAGRFAALSTLGGIAAFATVTIPFVLLPRAKAGERGALVGALASATALGGAAVLAGVVAPGPIIELVFGAHYESLASLAAPYLLAMALLGIGRVLVADAVAKGAVRSTAAVLAVVALAHLGLMVAIGDTVRGLATATLLATGLMVATMAVVTLVMRRRRPAEAAAPLSVVVETAAPPLVLEPQSAIATLPRAPELPAPPDLGEPFPAPSPPAEEPEPPPAAPTPKPREDGTSRRTVVLILLALMVVGVVLRVAADRSIWLDEATSWYQSQLPFGAMIDDLRATDVHPPLFYSLLWVVVRVVGDSELGLRGLSIATGVALIPMLFVAGRALYDRRTGLIAAAFGTFAPILIWYSHEARMYSLLTLLAVVAIWAHFQSVETFKARYLIIYALSAAAMIWTHYFAVFPVAVLQVALLIGLWRRRESTPWKRALAFGLTTVAILALLLPLAHFAFDQFMANQDAGKGLNQPQRAGGAVAGGEVSPYAGLSNVIWAIWGYHSPGTMTNLVALWPLVLLGAFLALGRSPSRATYTLTAAALVPALLLTVMAFFQPFLFELRFNLTAVPMIALLGARAASAWPVSRMGRAALVGGVSATLLAGVADQQLNGANPRLYDFKGALADVKDRAGPHDVMLYEPHFLNNVIDYYSPGITARPLPPASSADDPSAKHIFVLASFSDDPANVQATKAVVTQLERNRTLIDHFSKPQVHVWELK